MKSLDLLESTKMLQKYGISTAKFFLAHDKTQAINAAKKIGFPIAMKILSQKIIHKTETGAVKINIQNSQETKNAFLHMQTLPGFQGTIIQQMLKGTEIIIGGKKDPQFGPTILFGLGGIFVETLKDYSIRICPITRTDAKEMIHEIKGLPILLGTRNTPKTNITEIENTLLKTSKMLSKETQIQELDINPLIANKKKITAVDARIII